MKTATWLAALAALAPLAFGACDLSTAGSETSGDDAALGARDASLDTTPLGDGATGPSEAAASDAIVDSPADPDAAPVADGGPCKNNSTSCGAPGKCVDCTASASGSACNNGVCGCNGSNDCPSPMACQANKTCGSSCALGQTCNAGCCSVGACVAYDNNHCGGACTSCSGQTPTCGANGQCNGSCGGPKDGTCGTSCCNAGTCAAIGNQTCGDFGAACVNCNTAATGTNCQLIALHNVCGCAGPGSSNQCPTGKACYNNQCTTKCDAQHPCNGGCCSGNDLVTSTCVASCTTGMSCMGNYCQ